MEMRNESIPAELAWQPEACRQWSEVLRGRIVGKYEHKAVVLLAVLVNGQRTPMVIKPGVTDHYVLCRENLALGDLIAVEGVFVDGRGNRKEYQIHQLRIVKKCALTAEETGLLQDCRYSGVKARQYYHTLMATDPMCMFLLQARSRMFHTLYQALDEAGYTNCTTPVLNHSYFAGDARPFITHMLDNHADMFLRVTSEIALKHIIAGGLEKVYEVGNSFRNGSVNAMHNTPFMGAEIYQTYCTEPEHRTLAVQLLKEIQQAVRPLFNQYGFECKVDFAAEIPVMTFEEYVRSRGNPAFRLGDCRTYPIVPEIGGYTGAEHTDARLLYKWFKNYLIRDQLAPVFVTDQPSGISPLIARKATATLHRTYLVANGATLMEIAQSETDWEKIHAELTLQQERKDGDDYPRDYAALIHAYRFGIPPMCSLFIGVDRLIPAMLGAESINQYLMYL